MSSPNNSFYRFFYISALLLFIVWLVLTLQGLNQWAGISMSLFFLSLAIAFRGHQLLKGFTYTVTILAVVSLAMYYPQYFIGVGDFKYRSLINPLMQVIMFGMGTALSVKDFGQVFRNPKGVVVGVGCQFVIMPFVGLTLATVFTFPPEIAAGIILIGCSPSGLASNVMSFLARANLALSVTITTICTLLAPIFTPLLMRTLGGSFVEINFWNMAWDITQIVILPIIAGLLFNYFLHGKIKWLDKAMPLFSMVAIALVLMIITAAGRDNLLKVGGMLIVVTLIHNFSGYFLGYWSGRLFRFPERDCRTIALEVGMQNAGLASALAASMGKAGTMGLASVIFGTMMNVTGSSLASWWHNRVPKGDQEPAEGEKVLEPVMKN